MAATRSVHGRDPRFRGLVTPGSSTLADELRRLNEHRAAVHAALRRFRRDRNPAARRLQAIREMSLEEAIIDVLKAATRLSDRNVTALIRRLGLDGSPPLTLRDAGATIGFTASRLGQIEAQFRRDFPDTPLYLPQLDRAIEIVELHAPCEAAAVARILNDEHLTRSARPVPLVLAASRFFGRAVRATLSADERSVLAR
jgi:hypothetical protein